MRAGRPSRTAEQNAAFRAAESAKPASVHGAIVSPAILRSFSFLNRHHSAGVSGVLPKSARQQLAAPLEYRVSGGCQVSVDPLEIAHDVEKELAHLDALSPA
jgi:hypothetical protein